MVLGIEDIKRVTQGASKVIYEDGRFKFFRFSDEELKSTDSASLRSAAGIQLEFRTDGKILKLNVNTSQTLKIRSYFSFDIFIDGQPAGYIKNFNDEDCIGDYANKVYKTGDFYGEFELGKGEKTVKIVFPHSLAADITDIEITDATFILPVKKEKILVAYGDSITQGYDALHPSNAYIRRMADYLNAELINKSLGGVKFLPNLAAVPNGIDADYIFVAYGTNDWNASDKSTLTANAESFFAEIEKNYPHTTVIVITPIWRYDYNDIKMAGSFSELTTVITEISNKYKNTFVIPGVDLIPHSEDLFGDLILHPNDKGFEYYYENLLCAIKKLLG
jgi:lysophospholipase L1-like esterase